MRKSFADWPERVWKEWEVHSVVPIEPGSREAVRELTRLTEELGLYPWQCSHCHGQICVNTSGECQSKPT